VVPLAPRYDPVILELVRRLDEPSQPIAEVVRRVGEGAEMLGHFRPSYSHLRRYIRDERDRREAEAARRAAVREAVEDVAIRVLTGRMVNPYVVADRFAEASKRRAGRTGLWL
jgi:hypothetical protein